MATLATQTITRAGLEATYAAAAGGGDQFTPTNRTFLHVVNGGGAPITVTIEAPNEAIEDVEMTDLAIVVTNGEERLIGPFPGGTFADPADGLCDITYSDVTSVTIAAIELP